MPTYAYHGRDKKGTLVNGQLRASSESSVADHLSKMDIYPIKIFLAPERFHFSFKNIAKIHIGSSAPKMKEMIALSRNIGVMLSAGISITKTLKELAIGSKSKSLKKALFDIVDSIKAGESLAAAMGKYPDLFNSLYVNTITIGETSGNLAEIFTKLATYLEMEDENSKRLVAALRYPKFVLSALTMAILIINIFVIPTFKKLFQSFSATLPLPTRMLMATSDFIINDWYIVICIVVLFMIVTKALLRIPEIRYVWDRLKLSIPIIGPLVQKIVLTRFTWSFSMLLKNGSPMLTSLKLVAGSTGNVFIKTKIDAIKKFVEDGKSLSDSIARVDIFTNIDLQMLIAGEESGSLDAMLEKIAREYDKESEYELKRFGEYIEPIILLVMGVMVAILALGVFLPMWDMGRIAIKQ